jgi:hypothetical protein
VAELLTPGMCHLSLRSFYVDIVTSTLADASSLFTNFSLVLARYLSGDAAPAIYQIALVTAGYCEGGVIQELEPKGVCASVRLTVA